MKTILAILIGFVLGFSVMFELEVRDLRREARRQTQTDTALYALADAQDEVDRELAARVTRLEALMNRVYRERVSSVVINADLMKGAK